MDPDLDYLNGGETCKEACVISLSFSVAGAQVEKNRMHVFLALLSVSLAASGCSSLPTKAESIRNSIQSITNIAQITLVHIKKLKTMVPMAQQLELSTPPIEGLTGISRDLGLLENELQSPFTDLLSQIQADVSSLEGMVRFLALTVDCPVQPRPRGETIDTRFPDSHHHLTVEKVQSYLEQLLLHKDKLKVC